MSKTEAKRDADAAWARFEDKMAEVAKEHRKNERSKYTADDRKTWSEIVKSKKVTI